MKTLYFAGPTWMFVTPEQMYGEEGKLRSAHKHYKNADIYFLTKMRKVRFKPEKSGITGDGKIKVVVSLGDPTGQHDETTFVFPAIELLYSMEHISTQFRSRENFFVYVLLYYYKPQRLRSRLAHWIGSRLIVKRIAQEMACSLLKWSYSREVRVSHKNAYEISIEDPLARALTDDNKVEEMKQSNPAAYERIQALFDADWDTELLKSVDYKKLPGSSRKGTLRLTVDQVINHFEVDVGPQEIVYIGKTEREPFERLLPHEKLQELQSRFLRNDGEAIVVHLFGFKVFDVEGVEMKETCINASEAVTANEAELINYFKPVMNDKYVRDAGKRKWVHMVSLKSKGYRQIVTLLEVDGQYTKFVTAEADSVDPNRHMFVTDLYSLRRVALPAET